jgi:putative ABC transport system permease protein
MKIGDSITVRHGLETNEQGAHDHGKMPVVGILNATQTALDKGVFMTMYTVWDVHYDEYHEQQEAAEQALAAQEGQKNAKPHENEGEGDKHNHHEEQAGEHTHAIPPDFTTVTALVVKLKSPVFYDSFVRSVNDGTSAQAALPIREISGLFSIVGNVNGMLLGVSYLVILVAAMAIVAAMYNSLNERRRELAILRSLGAHRRTTMGLMLAEAGFIGFAGVLVGLVLARCSFHFGKGALERVIGTRLELAWVYSFDVWIGAGVVALSVFVAFVPAWQAYRTDVAENLAPLS